MLLQYASEPSNGNYNEYNCFHQWNLNNIMIMISLVLFYTGDYILHRSDEFSIYQLTYISQLIIIELTLTLNHVVHEVIPYPRRKFQLRFSCWKSYFLLGQLGFGITGTR